MSFGLHVCEKKGDVFQPVGSWLHTRQDAEDAAEIHRSRGVYAVRIVEDVVTYYKRGDHESPTHYAVRVSE